MAERELVLQVPAPVAAEALGFHHTATQRQRAAVGGTWSQYATRGKAGSSCGWLAVRLRKGSRPSEPGTGRCPGPSRTSGSRTRFPLRLFALTAFGGLPGAVLPSEEFEGFLDELCVELEDAAVTGVGVGHQLTVRQAAGQVG